MTDAAVYDGGPHIVVDTGPPEACNATGHVGAHPRTGGTNNCVNGATPRQFPGAVTTIQEAFGIPAGILADPTPGRGDYQAVDHGMMPATAPFNGFAGGICAQPCNTSVADTCGACANCSAALTQMPLVQVFGGLLAVLANDAANRPFGADTGMCRLDCTYDRTTAGDECPAQMTCDQFSNVCVESCTTDNECNTAYGVTYTGELVTLVNTMNPEVCNTTTGRCEQPATVGRTTAMVGDHCEGPQDCAQGTGLCLNGGHCAEFGCANPNTATSTCGGTRGICLSTSNAAHPTTLCLGGCNTAMDCGAGAICNALLDSMGAVVTIGGFTGYCVGQCDTDDQCIATEACTDSTSMNAAGMTVSNPGRCVPRCGDNTAHTGTPVGMVGTVAVADAVGPMQCHLDEWCSPDASNTPATYGQCLPLGAFCGESDTHSLPAHATDCAMTQVCDETLSTPHNQPTTAMPVGAVRNEVFGDGHCVNACTDDASCTAAPLNYPVGSVCVQAPSVLAGLCRMPCVGGMGDAGMGNDGGPAECPHDQVCDTALHYCVEVLPPVQAP